MIGAFTGQMNPADDGERVTVECDCAARIFAARSALTCWRESISSASARSLALSEARSAFLRSRASPSALLRREQLVAEDAHLMDADGDDLRLVLHGVACDLRVRASGGDLVPRGEDESVISRSRLATSRM